MSRIAVVDDEPAIAEGVAAYLRRDGHAVEVAASAPAAIELGRTGPDLMILDLMLGGGSGFDVLRTLRGEGRRVPVIILSARVDVIDRVAGLELGADDYITKPFEPRELVARVGAVLRRAQGEGARRGRHWPAGHGGHSRPGPRREQGSPGGPARVHGDRADAHGIRPARGAGRAPGTRHVA